MTNQPRHPQPRPGARHPRRPPAAARQALTILGTLLLSLAVAPAAAPAASATSAPPEPPPGPPPPPPTVTTPGLPLWAVLVILGGTVALSATTTLITLTLQPTAPWRRPWPPNRDPAKTMHQPPPPARPAGPPAGPFAGPPDPHSPSAARARGQLPLIPHHRRSS
jgi:hypothetical protein